MYPLQNLRKNECNWSWVFVTELVQVFHRLMGYLFNKAGNMRNDLTIPCIIMLQTWRSFIFKVRFCNWSEVLKRMSMGCSILTQLVSSHMSVMDLVIVWLLGIALFFLDSENRIKILVFDRFSKEKHLRLTALLPEESLMRTCFVQH